jgi:tRNA (guanine-N7-)-methyltransferase
MARRRPAAAPPAPRPGLQHAGDALPHRPFHGRRHGRRLRAGQKHLLESLLPRLAVDLPPGGRLDPAALFDRPDEGRRRIWLEIGFGAGEHLAWQARAHPAVGLIGAEVFVNGIAQLLRRIEAEGLDNVRIYQNDARDLLAALPAASIDRAFVLFPDPWPKARHRKRRLIQPETADDLARILADGAELRLATDDPAYAGWMLEILARHPAFAWQAEAPDDWRRPPADWPATRYQAKAEAAGRPPVYLRFARIRRFG